MNMKFSGSLVSGFTVPSNMVDQVKPLTLFINSNSSAVVDDITQQVFDAYEKSHSRTGF